MELYACQHDRNLSSPKDSNFKTSIIDSRMMFKSFGYMKLGGI
jgi:hypothetical protein